MREIVALKLNTHWNELLMENWTFSHHLILCTPCFLYKEVLIFTKLILVKIPIRISNSHYGGGWEWIPTAGFIHLLVTCKFSVPDTIIRQFAFWIITLEPMIFYPAFLNFFSHKGV